MTRDARPGTDAIAAFFDELDARGHEPVWRDISGTVAIELIDGDGTDSWRIGIDKGDITVSHDRGDADCSIRLDTALFDQLVRGRANAMAGVLRGAITPVGSLEMLLALQRVFPGPRDQQRPAPIGRSSRWEP